MGTARVSVNQRGLILAYLVRVGRGGGEGEGEGLLLPKPESRLVGGGGGGDGGGGGLAMLNSEKEMAVEVVYSANEEVSQLILRLAEERLKALQTAAHALDQRVTQVAAFQFAAAAFVGGAAFTGPMSLFAGASAIAFVVGGVVAFRGVRSDEFHLPGIAPNWWEASRTLEAFEANAARGWAAGAYQTAISQTDIENCERAKYLNLSLRYAMCGAALMAFTAFLRIFI